MAVDILLSYAFHSTTDLAAVKEALGPDQYLMIDSGAFTAHTIGKEILLPKYVNFLNKWKGTYDYAMSLDVIGDAKGTAANLLQLQDLDLPIIPVYTARAKIEELRALAKDYDYIAYGGTVGVPKEIQQRASKRVCDEAGALGAKIHVLGQAGLPMFRLTGAHSGDSSTASRAAMLAVVNIYNPVTHKQVIVKMGDQTPWIKNSDVLKAYGLSGRECMTGDAVRGKQRRTNTYRAGILSHAIAAADLKNQSGKTSPRIYSALTTGEVVDAGIMAAVQWRTGDLPHPLDRVKR